MKAKAIYLFIITMFMALLAGCDGSFLDLAMGDGAADVPRDGLVAEYLFSGNANDTSGNGNNGTVSGAALTTDRFGNADSAYSFDGVNDFIAIPDSSIIRFNSEDNFTISLWIKMDNYLATDDFEVFISKYASSSSPAGTFTWALMIENDVTRGQPNAFQMTAGSSYFTNSYLNSTEQYIVSSYYHIVFIFNGSTSSMKLYINNSLSDESPWSSGIAIADSSKSLMIGNQSDEQSWWYTGSVDDVRIYNRALTEDEINALYNEVK